MEQEDNFPISDISLPEPADLTATKTIGIFGMHNAVLERHERQLLQLEKLIFVNKEVANDDRAQVNDGFQQLNKSIQSSIQALNAKFKAQHDDLKTAVHSIASIQSQAAEFQASKLHEVIASQAQE